MQILLEVESLRRHDYFKIPTQQSLIVTTPLIDRLILIDHYLKNNYTVVAICVSTMRIILSWNVKHYGRYSMGKQ